MNINSQIMDEISLFASIPEDGKCVVINKRKEQASSIPELSRLQDIIKEIGPLPEEALFLGIAEDDLPVLLNLCDPMLGPILVAGDSKAGKTDFLKAIAHFVVLIHGSSEIQYGVLTDNPYEWDNYINYPHCVGIFSPGQKGATNFIRALAMWMEMDFNSKQSVLLLIDDLNDFVNLNSDLDLDLQKILLYGPAKNVWPIVTLNLEDFRNANIWLRFFQTRIFGYTKHTCVIDDDCYYYNTGFETLSKGKEFSYKEDSKWIKFRIPKTS